MKVSRNVKNQRVKNSIGIKSSNLDFIDFLTNGKKLSKSDWKIHNACFLL